MNLAKNIIEKVPSIRWRKSEFISRTLYKRAFQKIGKGSVIVSPLKMVGVDKITIGKDVNILEGSWLQTENGGSLTIGNNVYIGHRCHLHAVEDVTIGDNCVIADNVMINSGEHTIGNLSKITSRGPINVGEGVFIGQNVCILSGVFIGDNAVIGAGAIVTKNVEANTIVVGIPAKPYKN